MDFLAEGFRRALALLFSGDAEVYGIALLTLKIGVISTVLACGLGIPLGFVLGTLAHRLERGARGALRARRRDHDGVRPRGRRDRLRHDRGWEHPGPDPYPHHGGRAEHQSGRLRPGARTRPHPAAARPARERRFA